MLTMSERHETLNLQAPANRPSVGRIVMVIGGAAEANGTDQAPAIITRVWNDTLVNVTVFPDVPTTGRHTSIQLFPDEGAGRAWLAESPNRSVVAYWPARV